MTDLRADVVVVGSGAGGGPAAAVLAEAGLDVLVLEAGPRLEAADFVNKLIQRKPINRLGLNGPQEVKEHPWFKNYEWEKLYEKKIPSPFIPPKEDNFDYKYTNSEWKDNDSE